MIRNPFEQFELVRVVPMRIGVMDISLTNSSVYMLIGVGIVGVMLKMIVRRGGKVVPGRWQSVIEGMYRLVVGMIKESVGKEKGGEYVGVIVMLFMCILVSNLAGLVPYSYTVTAQLVITMALALWIWIGKLMIGIKRHGNKLWSIFIPHGVPFGMVPFFVLIEVVGYIIPVISLSVRLFANMMSGHVLLKVLFGFAWTMFLEGGIMMIVDMVPLGVLFLLLGLETAVAMIQAYVFTLLSCIYIGDMEKGAH